ncbi:Mrp/NBP35 family ATP-binding protein [archaeon]|nr:Mrp/NBP35 family ATP-binding protein [archaeon]
MEKSKEESVEREEQLKTNLSQVKHKIIVISGKGGVGKTTVAVNLAYGLADKGYHVGALDIDFHGPNLAKMLGIKADGLHDFGQGIEPVIISPNLKAMSLALMAQDPDQPIIWRGPLKAIAVKQLLGEVNWGKLDYLILDSPPGTGDELLSACQVIPDLDGALIVTTPQEVAVLDARKSVTFARELNVPIVGIIENMSGFTCPHCHKKVDLFKGNGGEEISKDLNIPFLGSIPLEPGIVRAGDSGKPFVHFKQETGTVDALEKIIDKIVTHFS